MDKLARYRKILKHLVEQYGKLQSSVGNVETFPICDAKTDNYMVVDVGWLAFGRQHAIPLHLRLKNEKVWVEWDGTDQEIVRQLVENGIPPEDIVLGFEQNQTLLQSDLIAA